jgi:hypothetical protein
LVPYVFDSAKTGVRAIYEFLWAGESHHIQNLSVADSTEALGNFDFGTDRITNREGLMMTLWTPQ